MFGIGFKNVADRMVNEWEVVTCGQWYIVYFNITTSNLPVAVA